MCEQFFQDKWTNFFVFTRTVLVPGTGTVPVPVPGTGNVLVSGTGTVLVSGTGTVLVSGTGTVLVPGTRIVLSSGSANAGTFPLCTTLTLINETSHNKTPYIITYGTIPTSVCDLAWTAGKNREKKNVSSILALWEQYFQQKNFVFYHLTVIGL